MTEAAGHFVMDNTVTQGDDMPYSMFFTDDDDAPMDISTWQFFHTVKASNSDTDDDALSTTDPLEFTVSNGDGINDKLSWLVSRALTINWPLTTATSQHQQDLQVIRSGVLRTWAKGVVVVEDGTTTRTAAMP